MNFISFVSLLPIRHRILFLRAFTSKHYEDAKIICSLQGTSNNESKAESAMSCKKSSDDRTHTLTHGLNDIYETHDCGSLVCWNDSGSEGSAWSSVHRFEAGASNEGSYGWSEGGWYRDQGEHDCRGKMAKSHRLAKGQTVL